MAEESLIEEAGEESSLEGEQDDGNRAVASSMVASWGYDRAGEQIEVFFINGREEVYSCTPEQWAEAKEAPSPGRFMHEHFL